MSFSFISSHCDYYLLINQTLVVDPEWPQGRSALDLYFLRENGSYFKSVLCSSPYFSIICKDGFERDVDDFLKRKFENLIEKTIKTQKEDLNMVTWIICLMFNFIAESFIRAKTKCFATAL